MWGDPEPGEYPRGGYMVILPESQPPPTLPPLGTNQYLGVPSPGPRAAAYGTKEGVESQGWAGGNGRASLRGRWGGGPVV